MANEIYFSYDEAESLYALIWRKTDDKVYDAVAGSNTFDTYTDADILDYDVPLANIVDSDYHSVDFPSGIAEGTYRVQIMLQVGGAIDADVDYALGQGEIHWDGAAEITLASLFTGTYTHHVAKTGSDSNSGHSLADALLTITQAEANAAAGDIIIIHPGTYADETLSFAKVLILKGTNRHTCKIVDSAADGLESDSSITLEDLWIESTWAEGKGVDFQASTPDDITIRRCTMIGALDGLNLYGAEQVWVEDCYMKGTQDGCHCGNHGVGTDVFFENCYFHTVGTYNANIHYACHGWGHLIFDNCIFHAERNLDKTGNLGGLHLGPAEEGAQQAVLNNCSIFAENSHADATGGVLGVRFNCSNGLGSCALNNCAIYTISAGSGDVFDIQQIAGTMTINNCAYTTTDGTIITVNSLANSACDTALSDIGLDHLIAASVADEVVDNSIIAKLVSKDATADWSDYAWTTESLEALKDAGIQAEVQTVLETNNLDHLLKVDTGVAVDGDLSGHVITGSILAHIMASGKDVTTAYNCSTDSLEAIKVHADTIKAETALIVADTSELQIDDVPGLIATAQSDLDTITGTGGALIATNAMDRSGTLDVNTKTITANAITATAINADAITNAKIADNAIAVENIKDAAITAAKIAGDAITAAKIADDAIAAEHIADAAIDNATFAADVGSTAHGTNIIALAVRKILEELNLDHLAKVTTGVAADGDLSNHVVDATILSHLMTVAADTSTYNASTDSHEALASGSGEGPGDYSITAVIRTTGGTAIPGVSVWLSTTGTRSDSIVKPAATDDSGQVTFNLNYGTAYHIHCHLAGYSFANASMTPASGSGEGYNQFTKDIGTAASATADSNYSESFLSRAIADVRSTIDEPTINAKYSDSDVILKLEKAYGVVIGEINRNAQTPIVARATVTITNTVTKYTLPHDIGMVVAIYEEDDNGLKVFFDSTGEYNPIGRGVWVEGSTLNVQTTTWLPVGTELTVEYIPIGSARLHNGTLTLDADGDLATLGATPHAGTLDTHVNGYAGYVLRVLKADGNYSYLQERTITAYDNEAREATLGVALNPIPTVGSGSIYYEIAPSIHKGLDQVLALYTAYMIASTEGSIRRARSIQIMYKDQIRNLRLTAYYSLLAQATDVRADNYDNRKYPYNQGRR